VSGMKAKAGTSRSGRAAAALQHAAPQRVVGKPAAKAVRAVAAKAVVKKKAAAPPKEAKASPSKIAAKPVRKPIVAAQPMKPITKPVASRPAVPKPHATKAAPAKPSAAKAGTAKPGTAKPLVAKPDARPVAPKHTEPKPTVSKPSILKPAAPKPPGVAQAKPAVPPSPAVTAKTPPLRPAAPLQTVQPKPPATPAHPAPAPAPAAVAPPAPPQADRRPMMPDRPPARPMAKAEIFIEGDHVVYPTHGVGKVERIATEEIAGHKLELIHITFEENRMTLRVPVAKARTAGLRKLATRKLFDEALTVLKGRARIKRTMWSRRAQEYEAKINSGDPLAIAEVVRDLHRNAGQPDQSFSERQIYEAAMDRLAAELAALDKTDKMTAATKLANFLKTV
jgi:CarD family transcriptional regulator